MAALRSKKAPLQIGSASWISTERDAALDFVRQEEEEFEYSALNEIEWLNEHMAEVFSKTRKCITDFFKTPGKLRGKTPRTIKKRNAPEARAPLTDIFAPNQQAASSSSRPANSDNQKTFQDVIEEVARRTLLDTENTRSPSEDGSSPAQPVLRKSSLSFAALPARGPLASIGNLADDIPTENSQPEKAHTEMDYVAEGIEALAVFGNIADEVPAENSPPEEQPHTEVNLVAEAREALAAIGNIADDIPASNPQTEEELHHAEDNHVAEASEPLAAVGNLVDEIPASSSQPEKQPHTEVKYPQVRTGPHTKVPADEISASKAKLSSIFQLARGVFASSAEISAHAKMENLALSTTPPEKTGGELDQPDLTTKPRRQSQRTRKPSHEDINTVAEVAHSAKVILAEENAVKDQSLYTSHPEKAGCELDQPDIIDPPRRQSQRKRKPSNEDNNTIADVEHPAKVILAEENGFEPDQPDIIDPPRRQSRRKRKSSNEDNNTVAEVEHPAKVILAEEGDAKVQGPDTSHFQSQPVTRSMKDVKRPTKPGQVPTSKAKPVPVAIKVGMTSQRELDHRKGNPVNPSNTTLSSNLQQSLGPVAASTRQTRPVATNLRKVTTNSTLKSSVSSSQQAKPRALAAAARKKEQDEREAQRRLEAKRELERKRLAQQEEEKKKKRLENAKKPEQQRNGPMQTRTRNGNNLASAMQQEKTQANMGPLSSRGELSNARPVSKMHTATNVAGPSEESSRIQPQINPARPPKRGAQVETTDERPYGPPSKVTSTYIQAESKRRKTNGEDDILIESRQAMQPPMRQSNHRKDTQPNKLSGTTQGFNINTPLHHGPMYLASLSKSNNLAQHDLQANKPGTGYSHPHHPDMAQLEDTQQHKSTGATQGFNINPSVPYGPMFSSTSLFKPNPLAQHDLHSNRTATGHTHPPYPDMAKFANMKIPFGDNQGNNAGPSTIQKTGQKHLFSNSNHKLSSPSCINPSDIELPDIPTDSEEEDDEDDYYKDMRKQLNLINPKKKSGFVVPDWAKSPALREILISQQLMDPQKIFGPIPPINLEEVFKNANPKQLARYRQRTSSANWSGPDRLTEEEIRKDFEARKKLMEQGEWSRDIGM